MPSLPPFRPADPTGTAYSSSRTPAQVTIRPDRIADGNLPGSQRSIDRWFDVSAFAAPQAGHFGTSGVGVLFGPPSFVMKSGLAKSFSITEKLQAKLAITVNNVTKSINYSPPAINISSAGSVGKITGIGNTAFPDMSGTRNMRLMLRLEW